MKQEKADIGHMYKYNERNFTKNAGLLMGWQNFLFILHYIFKCICKDVCIETLPQRNLLVIFDIRLKIRTSEVQHLLTSGSV